MSYKLNYGNSAAAFPSDVTDVLGRAGADELRVFIYVCACGGKTDVPDIVRATSCDESAVEAALSFWRGTGLISSENEKKTANAKKAKSGAVEAAAEKPSVAATSEKNSKKLSRSESLPNYTSEELAAILEKREETALLITECQQIMGKVFNIHEVNILMGFIDYLGLDNEYIMILFKYCADVGKKTLHYAEKLAFSLYDAGVTEASVLSEELRRRETTASIEGKIRSIFGIGTRTLTSREKKEISSWINDMKYSSEIIEKAYEITVDATGKGSVHYANSVLERWHSEGFSTLAEINASYENKKTEGSSTGSSFDTDEFFEAAVRRSLGDN